jgi:hypothetical protein
VVGPDLALAASGGQTPAAVRAHYREKIGHEIDGPEATVESLRGYHDRLAADFERQRAPVERRQEAEQGRPGYRLRRLYLYVWTVSTAVPAHVAANADPAVLNGFLTWEDEEKDD